MAWFILGLVAVGLAGGLAARTDWRARFRDALRHIQPWFVLALAVMVGGLLFDHSGVVFFVGLVALFLLAWVHEFTLLMRQGDDAFPGRFDKPIWALLLIVLPPVGVLAFWSYRQAHGSPAKVIDAAAYHELS